MTDSFFSALACAGVLGGLGFAIGFFQKEQFSWRWLLVAVGLFFLNYALLNRAFGLIPYMLSDDLNWNWQGKIIAIIATLAVAAHPAFGWRRIGLTLAQNTEGRKLTYGVAAFMVIAFIAASLADPNPNPNVETLAFQLTMPGFDEEPFYRGVLLLALGQAFRGTRRFLGIDAGWATVLSSVVFGLVHGLIYQKGGFAFDPMTTLGTGVTGFALLWFRERTGSLVLPVIMHNFINSVQDIF